MKLKDPKHQMKTAMATLLGVSNHLRALEIEAAEANDAERQLAVIVAQERMQEAFDLLNKISERTL